MERNLKELYNLVLKELKTSYQRENYKIGICAAMAKLSGVNIITHEESIKLNNHFKKQKPNKGGIFNIGSKHKEFATASSFSGGAYWWYMTKSGLEERIKFIEFLINKL